MIFATITQFVQSNASSDLLALVAILTVIFLIAHRASRSKPRYDAKPLPGPPSWPVVGSIPALSKYTKQFGHRAFTEIAREYGPIYGLKVGLGQQLVILNDRATIREALVTQASKMTSRHVQGLVKVSLPIQGSLAWENGPIWSARRRFILGAFRALGFSKSGLLEQRIQREAEALCTNIDSYNGMPLNLKPMLECATTNLFCAISLGDRYDYHDPEFSALVHNAKIVLDNLSAVSIGNYLPFLYHTPFMREFRTAMTWLDTFIRGFVEQHKETFNGNKPRDVTDLYLAEVTRRKNEGEELMFEEGDVSRTLMDILVAGAFTTSSLLLWTFLFMTQYQDIQAKIHEEIDDVIGKRPPSLDDCKVLPYTQATLYEIQRHRTSTVIIPHLATEDAVVGGCLIPKGAQVIANTWALHHDPQEWKEPDKFDPSRFLEKKSELTENFSPFGLGPRRCPGEQIAKHEVFLIFATIMQRYKLAIPASDPTPNLEGVAVGPALEAANYRICAELR